MATDIHLIGSDGTTTFYFVNSNAGIPTPGGSPGAAATTPFAVDSDWTLTRADRLDSYVDETLPLVYHGTSAEGAKTDIAALRALVTTPATGDEALVVQPNGVTSPESYGVYFISRVQERAWPNSKRSPSEGAIKIAVDVTLRRTAEPGVTILEELLG